MSFHVSLTRYIFLSAAKIKSLSSVVVVVLPVVVVVVVVVARSRYVHTYVTVTVTVTLTLNRGYEPWSMGCVHARPVTVVVIVVVIMNHDFSHSHSRTGRILHMPVRLDRQIGPSDGRTDPAKSTPVVVAVKEVVCISRRGGSRGWSSGNETLPR